MIDLKNKLTEEYNCLIEICNKIMYSRFETSKHQDKWADELFQEYIKRRYRVEMLLEIIDYHDEKHSLSPEVKEAREKTDEYINDIKTIVTTSDKVIGMPGLQNVFAANEILKTFVQSERNAADKE